MSDSGFDNADQRRAAIEHAASLTALNQRADQVSAAYRTILTSETIPPERMIDLRHSRQIPSVVSTEGLPPERIGALNRKLTEYKKRFEDGSIQGKALRYPDDAIGVIGDNQEKTILLQLLLENGSLNFDIAKKALKVETPEDESYLIENYHLIYDYATTGGEGVTGGTGLAKNDEESAFQELISKRVPEVWGAARRLARGIPADQLQPSEFLGDNGKPMRARLMKQLGHEDGDTGGVVAELTETHKGIDVGVKEYVYLGFHDTSGERGQQGLSAAYRAKKLGNHINILKEPLGYISARDEDYPGVETYWLTAASRDEDETEHNATFLSIVGTFGSLVEANKENLGKSQ